RQADALAAYRRVRTHLADELGLEPGPALRSLQAQILEQAPALALDVSSRASRPTASTPSGPHAPEGTIALLLTDIQGSTRLANELGDSWPAVLEDHHALLGAAIEAEGGFVEVTEGDAFFAAFEDAVSAGRAAVAIQRGLHAHAWPE